MSSTKTQAGVETSTKQMALNAATPQTQIGISAIGKFINGIHALLQHNDNEENLQHLFTAIFGEIGIHILEEHYTEKRNLGSFFYEPGSRKPFEAFNLDWI